MPVLAPELSSEDEVSAAGAADVIKTADCVVVELWDVVLVDVALLDEDKADDDTYDSDSGGGAWKACKEGLLQSTLPFDPKQQAHRPKVRLKTTSCLPRSAASCKVSKQPGLVFTCGAPGAYYMAPGISGL